MFHHVPEAVLVRMQHLEEIDAKDRVDGTPHSQRLLQIPPETGRFIALVAAAAPRGTWLEIGTSAGYSTLWLALACRERSTKVVTFEVLEEKAKMASETFKDAGVENYVELVVGDAREYLDSYSGVSFCFLDAEKGIYHACYERVIPNMVSGGFLVADNAISHEDILRPMIERALNDERVDALVVPIGRGELVCRKL
jgi:predicted O-methyltransferase YrrM